MVAQLPPSDPVAYQAWLEETLTPDDAADFVKLNRDFLQRMRVTGGGPPFIRLGPRTIVYVRRDLIEWRASRRHTSTSEYARRTQEAESGLESISDSGEGE